MNSDSKPIEGMSANKARGFNPEVDLKVSNVTAVGSVAVTLRGP